MAFVRRVPTGSGATAVQVFEYAPGGQRMVKHVGSASTQEELVLLWAEAYRWLAEYEHPGQDAFDLGIEPTAAVKLLQPREPGTLLRAPKAPTLAAAKPEKPAAVPSARVVATASRLIYDVLAQVYAQLGFDALGDEVFRDLVIARIVEPTSLLDAGRILEAMGRSPAPYITMRRTLKRCYDGEYRDQIAAQSFEYAQVNSDISLCLYDVTTLRTHAETEDAFRRPGFSKDRSIDPQIVLGLLVDRFGHPLEIAAFEGNKAEQQTITTVIDAFSARHSIENMVIVADAGMMTAPNLRALDDAGYSFIVGARTSKAPIDLESHFTWHGDAFTDGQLIDTVTPKTGKNLDNNPKLKAEPAWDVTEHAASWRAVWAYSAKRFARDNKALNGQEERARKVVDGDSAARKPRFVKASTSGYTLDDRALARARRLAGLKGYVTNIPATVMPAGEIVASYHDLWHVEQSFRISKTDLAARPLFARRREAIEAHLTIMFAALAITRAVYRRSGTTIRRVRHALLPLREATIAINGTTHTYPPELNADDQALVDAILANGPVTH